MALKKALWPIISNSQIKTPFINYHIILILIIINVKFNYIDVKTFKKKYFNIM